MKNASPDPALDGKVALITGSSMGIGKAIAQELGRLGAVIVVNGRNAERLTTTADELIRHDINALAVPADVAKPDEVTKLIDRVVDTYGRLDILINNAGVSMRSTFENLQDAVVQQVIGSNLYGAINLTRAALPHIRSSQGTILFISSLAGIRGLPYVSVYGAAKMALTGLAESLKLELQGTGVHVGLVYVGITQNESDKRVLDADGHLVPIEWAGIQKGQSRERVARSVVKAIKKRKFKSVLTGLGRFEAILNRFAPGVVGYILSNTPHTLENRFR